MNTVKSLLFVAVMSVACFLNAASQVGNPEIIAKLQSQLSASRTQTDSVRLLYNLFDVTLENAKVKYGWDLVNLAIADNNQELLSDMIPQMGVIERKNETGIQQLITASDNLEDTVRRKAVKLFLEVSKASNDVLYIPAEDQKDMLLKYAQADMTHSDDIYREIGDLYKMVLFLGQSTKGNLYLEYLTRLEGLINQLPESNRHLRNLFYTTAANAHTRNGNHQKAVESDRVLLKIIADLDEKYKAIDRPYRDYSRNYYITYRRMLRNYAALTPGEINDLYAKCMALAEQNPEVKMDFYDKGFPTVYKLMAEKDYTQAIPHIKKAIPYASDPSNKRELMGMLVEAATATGDKETLLPALQAYNKVLEEKVIQNDQAAYRELQIRYDVNKLKAENMALEIDRRDAEINGRQKIITGSLAVLLAMAVILMLLYRSHFLLRRKVNALSEENRRLNKHIAEMLDDGSPAGAVKIETLQEHPEGNLF